MCPVTSQCFTLCTSRFSWPCQVKAGFEQCYANAARSVVGASWAVVERWAQQALALSEPDPLACLLGLGYRLEWAELSCCGILIRARTDLATRMVTLDWLACEDLAKHVKRLLLTSSTDLLCYVHSVEQNLAVTSDSDGVQIGLSGEQRLTLAAAHTLLGPVFIAPRAYEQPNLGQGLAEVLQIIPVVLAHELFHILQPQCPPSLAEASANLFAAGLRHLSYYPGCLDIR